MRVLFVFGTRPEIIKCFPVYDLLEEKKYLYTNQHFNTVLKDSIFKDFSYSEKDEILEYQVGVYTPDIILVQGDTWSAMYGAVLAKKHGYKLGHIEAGLRSYDDRMVEEKIRIMVDKMADIHFCTTEWAMSNLEDPSNAHVVGNTLTDNVVEFEDESDTRYNPVLTLHRPENFNKLGEILRQVDMLGEPVDFFMHPRVEPMIDKQKYRNINFMWPISYSEMRKRLSKTSVILTDSGGIQEEALIYQVPCVTLRETTERPETLWSGYNVLWGNNLLQAVSKVKSQDKAGYKYKCDPSARIVKLLEKL